MTMTARIGLAAALLLSSQAMAQTETDGTGEQASKQLSTPKRPMSQAPARPAPAARTGTASGHKAVPRAASPSALQPRASDGSSGPVTQP